MTIESSAEEETPPGLKPGGRFIGQIRPAALAARRRTGHGGAVSPRSRSRAQDDPSVYVVEERREIRRSRGEDPQFDPIAYAMRALRILKPRGMTVAVYEGRFAMKVERGREWARPAQSWVTVAIPRDATREDVALLLAQIAGVSAEPWILPTLLAAADVA